ncbi:MAG TPA: tetratricopeptide repeat protein [Verrucomicrobiae bacterium]|nr:tetratricopeptide repeat protein [Verrucomicrobiae bacterium]
MQERNPKFDPQDRAKAANQGSVGVPVKGDSSSSNAPSDSDAPTLIDFQPPTPDPEATIVDPDATIIAGLPRPVPLKPRPSRVQNPGPLFEPGDVLGGRYEILKLLGEGGMGAVYKARDRELDRPVALKLIRPELASSSSMLARFKQELLLSRQVTHKNVIRIYDLGDAGGVKFITMEFVEGQDLRALIHEKRKFSPEEAVEIMRQVCQALEAAHSVGVIHRDLKPQNIMRDQSGRILVMDFGLARTMEGEGMTQVGALVGTMEYMSPEQALAKELDQRSDLFTAGLILYELLTGQMPFKAESALASLIKRTQERAVPVSDHDETIPGALSGIVSKCLERDPKLRYQTAAELLRDLDAWQGKRAAATLGFHANVKPWGQTVPWPLLTGVATVLILAIAGYIFRGVLFSGPHSAANSPSASLAVIPFQNASGDSSWDWLGPSLADMLSTDIGQSSHLRMVSPDRVQQLFHDLKIAPNSIIDAPTVARVAEFTSADKLVWGRYAKFGDEIRIDATLEDMKSNRTVPLKIDVPSEKEIPGAIDHLAESIREKLSLPGSVLKELRASSFEPNSTSVDALRDYNLGVGSLRDGRNLDAQKQLESATKADPSFALAFSRLAQAYSTLGYDTDAEQASEKAVTLSQSLPESEKYLIAAIHSQVMKDYPEAIKSYTNLANLSPDNTDVQSALAGLYQDSGDLVKAREYYQKILSSNPHDVGATLDLGRIEIKSGNPQGSFDPLNRAYSLATQLDNQEQKATSLHLMAVAYRMLNKPQEVLRNETEALAIWRQIGEKRGLAYSLNETAGAESALGNRKQAEANYEEALQIRRDIGDKRGLGYTLIDLGNFADDSGDHDRALKMYKDALQMERDIGSESMQAICLNNIGTAYSEKGQYEDALTYYQQALQLREKSKAPQDIVEAIHNIGDTFADMGQYDQAVSYYLRALDLRRSMDDQRGAAIESHSLATLFDYQGRFGAAVNSEQDALKIFRDLKDRTTWMARVLDGSAEALILAGRADEAKSTLTESADLARELKNDSVAAENFGVQGDAYFFSGDFKTADGFYERARQSAIRSKEPDTILIANARLARVLVEEKRSPEAIVALKPLIQRAEDLGLKYVSIECTLFMAEAMIQRRQGQEAQDTLKRAVFRADQLGTQPLSARAHYLLATTERSSGNPSAAQQDYRESIHLLDNMLKDPGAQKLLQRADLKAIDEEATHYSKSN